MIVKLNLPSCGMAGAVQKGASVLRSARTEKPFEGLLVFWLRANNSAS